MPLFTFKCPECNTKRQMFVSASRQDIPCHTPNCRATARRQLPISNHADVTEIAYSHNNIVQLQGQREILEKRRDTHYWKNEVPRMVSSGVYSVQTMLEMGWVYLDERGEVQVYTKPKHER